jgi:hypothetical protein
MVPSDRIGGRLSLYIINHIWSTLKTETSGDIWNKHTRIELSLIITDQYGVHYLGILKQSN